jgi:molybdopterin-containing oxidoreductase family iron-sulfur binding subunit
VLNALAGNLGQSVRFPQPEAAPWASPGMSVDDLVKRARAGEVGALIVHHANPLGFGPVFAPLAEAFGRIPMVAVLTNQLDQTARRAHVVLPDHHFLEAWGDVSPRPGVRGIQQPVMTPVHATRAAGDVLLDIARKLQAPGLPDGTFDSLVRQGLAPADIERGGVFTEPPVEAVTLSDGALQQLPADAVTPGGDATLTLVVAPSIRYLDGLLPENPLLQEVPDPLTTIAWAGWVELGPTTARRLGVATGDVVRISSTSGQTELPAFVHPGVRGDTVAIPAPYAAPLLGAGSEPLGLLRPVRVEAVARKVRLAQLGGSLDQHGRELAREVVGGASLPPAPAAISMYPAINHPVHRWAMAVDLDRCTGCSACVAACYVENNSPVVGALEVARGRDMGWLHIQRFIEGPETHPRALFLPSMCQQCTNAPCESVCPVYATYHTPEGLNAQVYNRCVGTRYCENNCPYGARRFNWFDWPRPVPSDLGLNPDVSVRQRGITEKCTFCVQRIRGVEEQARTEERPVRDGEIVPACAQTCPSHALTFGDLHDAASAVAKLAANGRAYRMLEELNTAPGVVYLARRRQETPT